MKITVVVTTYNYARFLPDCLDSLFAQNFDKGEFEILVVDDCSMDDTESVLANYQNKANQPIQFRVIRNRRNLGGAATAMVGINAGQGQFFVRVDADDYVNPNLLTVLYDELLNNKKALGCACDYQIVDTQSNSVETKSALTDPVACGILHRRESFLALGGYNPEFRFLEEQEIRQRLGTRYRIAHASQVLYYYRKHGKNKTSDRHSLAAYEQKLNRPAAIS